jgi:hypothetical protein
LALAQAAVCSAPSAPPPSTPKPSPDLMARVDVPREAEAPDPPTVSAGREGEFISLVVSCAPVAALRFDDVYHYCYANSEPRDLCAHVIDANSSLGASDLSCLAFTAHRNMASDARCAAFRTT